MGQLNKNAHHLKKKTGVLVAEASKPKENEPRGETAFVLPSSQYLGEAALPARTRLTKLPAIARPLELAAAAMQKIDRSGAEEIHHTQQWKRCAALCRRRGRGREVEMMIVVTTPTGCPHFIAPDLAGVPAHRRTAPAIAIAIGYWGAALTGNLCGF